MPRLPEVVEVGADDWQDVLQEGDESVGGALG